MPAKFPKGLPAGCGVRVIDVVPGVRVGKGGDVSGEALGAAGRLSIVRDVQLPTIRSDLGAAAAARRPIGPRLEPVRSDEPFSFQTVSAERVASALRYRVVPPTATTVLSEDGTPAHLTNWHPSWPVPVEHAVVARGSEDDHARMVIAARIVGEMGPDSAPP